jgi:hypothetical protein
MKLPPEHEHPITIQDLYPELTPEQQQEAEYRLKQYIDIIVRIYERTRGLTTADGTATLRGKGGE